MSYVFGLLMVKNMDINLEFIGVCSTITHLTSILIMIRLSLLAKTLYKRNFSQVPAFRLYRVSTVIGKFQFLVNFHNHEQI